VTRRPLAWTAGLVAGFAALLALAILWPAPPAGPRPPALAFDPGARQAYRLALESTLHFAGGGGPAEGDIHQVVQGTLHVRVLEPAPEGARVAFQLAGARATLQGRSQAELDRQLARPFLATFAPDGRALRFELPADAGPEVRAVLEETIRTFEVVVPAAAEASWEADEEHAAGRYRASYRATHDGRILKRKLGYDRAAAAEGGPRVGVRRSEATARLEPGASWLGRMVVEEELTAALGRGLFTTSSLRAELVPEPVPVTDPALALDAGDGSYASLAATVGAGAAPPYVPTTGTARTPVRALAEVVGDLDARGRGNATLAHELRRLLLVDPGAASQVLALLRAGVPDATASALINGLGMAATPEAQAALRAVLEDPALGRMNRIRAALALGGGDDLTDETLAALRAVADGPRGDELVDTAVLALGMAANTLRRDDLERYRGLQADLVARAGRPGNEGAVGLLALGNARDPELAEVAAARLADDVTSVRDAAAHALGKLGDAGDPERLAMRLSVEPNPGVRATLAASLNALPPPDAATLALVQRALPRESDSQARFELARLLGRNLPAYPAGREALATLARTDPSRRIRQYAVHAVWGSDPTGPRKGP